MKALFKFFQLELLCIPCLLIGIFSVISCTEKNEPKIHHEAAVVFDIEGNEYQTIKIGSQWWMAENLRSTTLRDGSVLQQIDDAQSWSQTNMPAYCSFQGVPNENGLLYNLPAALKNTQLAPIGWHIPSDDDWKILESYLGMDPAGIESINWRGTTEGDELKVESTNTSGWIPYEDVWGNNHSGFSATGGSCRVFNGAWGVPGVRHSGYWWTSSTGLENYGWFRYLDYKKSGIFRYAAHPAYGFSIRCVKD